MQPCQAQLITCVILAIADQYRLHLTTKLQEIQEKHGDAVEDVDVLTELQKLAHELHTSESMKDEHGTGHETSLSTFQRGNGQPSTQQKSKRPSHRPKVDLFKGKTFCYYCWKKGHRANNCPNLLAGKPPTKRTASLSNCLFPNEANTEVIMLWNNRQQQLQQGDIKCGICGKNHPEHKCFELPKNAHKRPNGYVCKYNISGAAIEPPSSSNNDIIEDDNSSNASESSEVKFVTIDMMRRGEYRPDITLIDVSAPPKQTGVTEIETQLLEVVSKGTTGYLPFPDLFELLFNRNMWIYNTGASDHSTGDPFGMIGCIPANTTMLTAHGDQAIAQGKTGSLPCAKLDRFRRHEFNTVLDEVTYTKGNHFNLFGVNKLLAKGWKCYGDDVNGHQLEKDGKVVRFDICISTSKGCVWCAYFERFDGKSKPRATADAVPSLNLVNATQEGTKMKIMRIHELTGRHNEATTRAIAKELGWEIARGSWKACKDCAKAKAKRKVIPQVGNQDHKATRPCERIFRDITSLRKPMRSKPPTPFTSRPHMRILVDEYYRRQQPQPKLHRLTMIRLKICKIITSEQNNQSSPLVIGER